MLAGPNYIYKLHVLPEHLSLLAGIEFQMITSADHECEARGIHFSLG